jgi:hypothetical protein
VLVGDQYRCRCKSLFLGEMRSVSGSAFGTFEAAGHGRETTEKFFQAGL